MRRRNDLLLCAVLLVAASVLGCTSTLHHAQPPAANSAPAPPHPPVPARTAPGVQTLNLNGLTVTVATTMGATASLKGMVPVVRPAHAPKGKVRVTIIAKALNSTDTTIALQIKHNFPGVQDSRAKNLAPVTGWLSGPRSAGNHGLSGGLAPGGTLETSQSFDLAPAQRTGLRFHWNLGDAGIVGLTLP